MKYSTTKLGWVAMGVGLGMVAVFALALITWRFKHPEMTETQLMLWSLKRWWGWVPAFVVSGVGYWLVYKDAR